MGLKDKFDDMKTAAKFRKVKSKADAEQKKKEKELTDMYQSMIDSILDNQNKIKVLQDKVTALETQSSGNDQGVGES